MTLVELMVAMLLGLILTGGAIQVFIGNRAAYDFNEGLARLQENGRFAIDSLSFRTRMAGYFGCLPDIPIHNNLANAASLAFNFAQGLSGFEATGTAPGNSYSATGKNPPPSTTVGNWSPALPTDLNGHVIPGSDVLVVHNVSPSSHPLVSPYNDSAQIFVDAVLGEYAIGEIAIVSDCQKASVFQITNIGPAHGINVVHSSASFVPGNAVSTWDSNQRYGEGAELLRAETWVFYVGARGGNGPPALFQQRLARSGTTVTLAAQEIVEGVDTMQVLYGVDTDGDGSLDDYLTANAVDWTQVVAVRISLLMRTPSEFGAEIDAATYDVNGTTFNPVDDRRVRQVFTTTVALRNRLP